MTSQEVNNLIDSKLMLLRIQGDKEINVNGQWPNFTVHQRATPQNNQGGGFGAAIQGPQVYLSFQALTKLSSGTWKWGLWPGVLYNTFDNGNTKLTITGLLAPDLSSGFVTIGTYPAEIGLEIATDWSTDPPTVSSVSVIHTTALDRRVEYVSDGGTPPTYSQTYARIVCATAIDDGTGKPFLSYNTGDLTLWFTSATAVLSGGGSPQVVPCLYPF